MVFASGPLNIMFAKTITKLALEETEICSRKTKVIEWRSTTTDIQVSTSGEWRTGFVYFLFATVYCVDGNKSSMLLLISKTNFVSTETQIHSFFLSVLKMSQIFKEGRRRLSFTAEAVYVIRRFWTGSAHCTPLVRFNVLFLWILYWRSDRSPRSIHP